MPQSLNLRWLQRVALASMALALLASCMKAPVPPLRVATLPWPGYESIHLAQSLGYFDPSRIRILDMVNASLATQLGGSLVIGPGAVFAVTFTVVAPTPLDIKV